MKSLTRFILESTYSSEEQKLMSEYRKLRAELAEKIYKVEDFKLQYVDEKGIAWFYKTKTVDKWVNLFEKYYDKFTNNRDKGKRWVRFDPHYDMYYLDERDKDGCVVDPDPKWSKEEKEERSLSHVVPP